MTGGHAEAEHDSRLREWEIMTQTEEETKSPDIRHPGLT